MGSSYLLKAVPLESEKKETMIQEFREFLEIEDDRQQAREEDNLEVGLYTLVSEFLALRNEVKTEARQFKSALDTFSSAIDSRNEENARLSQSLEKCRENNDKAGQDSLKSLLVQILDLRDRIEAGVKAANRYKPKWFTLTGRKQERAVIQALQDGQELTLNRLDQLLISYDVRPMDVINEALNPNHMRAAEIEHIPEVENGQVTGELRKGFFFGDEVLRIAEVKVNKVK